MEISSGDLQDGRLRAAQLLKLAGLCNSTSDARRSIAQGGAYLGDEKTPIDSHDQAIEVTDGLKQGDWIVTAGVNSLTEGQLVKVIQ